MFSKIGNFIDKTEDSIAKLKNEALDYVPEINIDKVENTLEEIGISIPRTEISITIPPRISFEIDLDNSKINKEKEEKLLSEDIDFEDNDITKRMTIKILQGLESAIKLKDKLKFKNKTLSRVMVEGSVIPTVKLIYLSPKEVELEKRKD